MEGKLEKNFSHENQALLFLSEHERLPPAKRKSSIVGCILLKDFTSKNEGPNVSTKILDSAAIINARTNKLQKFLTMHK